MAPKKKKTKKQLLEEKREAEEQLAREQAELEAQQAAEAERQRLIEEEKARVRAEEEKKRQAEEAERLKEENDAYAVFYNSRRSLVKEVTEELRQWSEWQRYLECTKLPDPDSQKALNTYLSQWEDMVSTDPDELVDSVELAAEVVSHVRKQMPELDDEDRHKQLEWSRERCVLLLNTSRKRILECTDYALQKIESYADKDRLVVHTFKRPSVTFTLWSNLNPGAKLPRVLELPEAQFTCDMPKLLSRAQFAVRVLQTDYDSLDLGETGDERRALGGVLAFDMFILPPFNRKAINWNLRHIPEGFMDTAGLNHTNMPVEDEDTGGVKPNPQATAVHVRFRIPSDCLVRESPLRMAWWDDHAKLWSERGVENVQFDEELREVSCETAVLSPIAMVQSRSLDIPYGKWSLNPTGFNIATLTLELKTHTLVVEITEHFVKLMQPDLPELKDVLGKEMRPACLFARLSRSGFTVYPKNEDAAHIDTLIPKTSKVEKQLHECMSMLCQGYLYTGSVWNQAAGKDKCIVRLAEKPDVEIEPMLETYKTVIYMWEREAMKCAILDLEEHEAAYNDTKISQLTHIRLDHTMRPTMPEMCSDNIKNSSLKFQEAVRHTLDAVRLFSFA